MSEIAKYLATKGIVPEQIGKYLKVKCFYGTHIDKDPSFIIYPNDTCFCHGCNVWGNINTLRKFFGDKVIYSPKEKKNNTSEELMSLYRKRKIDRYKSVLRIRRMRKWYKDTRTLNNRLIKIIERHYEYTANSRPTPKDKA